nr:hypothetical protein [Tanacetum cinerariifolium]
VHLQKINPLPHFYEARSRLILEETRKSKQAANSAIKDGVALVFTMASSSKQTQTGGFNNFKPTTGNVPSSNNHGGRGGRYNRGGRNNCGRGSGRTNGGNNNYAHSTGQQPHVWGHIAPWAWIILPCPYLTSAWTRPTYSNESQGILDPRPQQAYAASVAPTTSYAPTDIETAMHTMMLNPPDEN